MTIEISDREYWKRFNWYDALLYCSMLEIDGKNDWRMIEDREEIDDLLDEINKCTTEDDDDIYFYNTWVVVDNEYMRMGRLDMLHWVIPVRDI